MRVLGLLRSSGTFDFTLSFGGFGAVGVCFIRVGGGVGPICVC